jgi:hypothetical protein
MIMTVAELRRYVETEEDDQVLEVRLQALEGLIRAYTNNNFQARDFRAVAVAASDKTLMVNTTVPFAAGDTLQITESNLMPDALVTVVSVDGNTVRVKEDLFDESGVEITKVKYPQDVKMGAVNLMKWELAQREKAGISSETISRHSVTYSNMDGENSVMGFPKSLMGFLRPYKKARVGRGFRV